MIAMDIHQILLNELETEDLTPQLELDIERVCQQVRNYCHIKEIPQELNFTVADMIRDLQKSRAGNNLTVVSVDIGDTSYDFNVDIAIDGLLRDYKTDLQRFRKVRW